LKRIALTFIFVSLFLLIFCTCNVSKEELTTALNSITQPELKDIISTLANDKMEGRLSGEKGCEMSAEYIANQFKEYGLKMGMEDSYYQKFSFTKGAEKGDKTSFNLTKSGKTIAFDYGNDYVLTGLSANVTFNGGLAFVGYSIITDGYNDYENIDVSGKIVIIMRYSPFDMDEKSEYNYLGTKIGNAIKQGAKGIIFLNGPNNFKEDTLMPLSYYYWRQYMTIPIIHLSWKGAEKILALKGLTLKALQDKIDTSKKPNSFIFEDVTVNLTTEVKDVYDETYNVVGYLPGTDPKLKDEVIVIGAHYDHVGKGEISALDPTRVGEIHNGADDNASGVAGMLEIAEAFSIVRSKRTLVFIAFSAEEYGLFGSKYYVENAIFPIDNTVFMCNMDMIGYLRGTLYLLGVQSSTIYDTIMNLDEKYTSFKVQFLQQSEGGSDHYYFIESNVPVACLHTGLHDVYHTPSDDVEFLDFDGASLVTQFAFELVYEVDSMKNRPEGTD